MSKEEFHRFEAFWYKLMDMVLEQTRSGIDLNDAQTLRTIYFMSGMLQCAADILKSFLQETEPNAFSPEWQEKVDVMLKTIVRKFTASAMNNIRKS